MEFVPTRDDIRRAPSREIAEIGDYERVEFFKSGHPSVKLDS